MAILESKGSWRIKKSNERRAIMHLGPPCCTYEGKQFCSSLCPMPSTSPGIAEPS